MTGLKRCMFALLAAAALAQQAVEFARSPEYSEGPAFDYGGNLYFSHGEYVSKVDPEGRTAVWAEVPGANGHKVLPDGTHLVCSMTRRSVLLLDADGNVLRAASDDCGGQPLRAPNDLTLDPRGGFWFSDPGDSRAAPIGTVHYVDAEGVTHLAAGGMSVPNGLVLSPDLSTLYVAETAPNRILAFPVEAPGKLGAQRVFAALPSGPDVETGPDGLAVDRAGNLYVAQLGVAQVHVLAPGGKLLRSLPTGLHDTSNVVFGGPNLDKLYVTGSVGHRASAPGRVVWFELPGVQGVSPLLPRAVSP